MDQCPELGTPTSEAQAWHLAGAPRPCQSHGQVRGEFFAFLEAWGLLPVFSRCSVGVVPHVDVFLMYLWGGRWSPPHLTPPPSWSTHPPQYILNLKILTFQNNLFNNSYHWYILSSKVLSIQRKSVKNWKKIIFFWLKKKTRLPLK